MIKKVSILILIILAISCKKDITTPPIKKQMYSINGTWTRTFETTPGNLQTAFYYIYSDSIRYILKGKYGKANYLIMKDTSDMDINNRFIGHTSTNEYYILYFKDVSNALMTVYKQKVNDVKEGLTIAVPANDETKNYGWNTFEKK